MLTGKQKSFLKSQAHDMQPIVQIGKNLVTETIIDTTIKALEARELIKISILQNCLADSKEVANGIVEHTGAHLVQVIGRTIILYKKSTKLENRKISSNLPK